MKKIILMMFVCSLTAAIFAQEKAGTIRENDQIEAPDQVKIEQISKIAETSAANTVVSYDFTTGSDKYYGGTAAAVEVETGVWAMIAGDSDQNGGIGSSDLISTRADLGSTDYNNDDVDMNGGVGSSDLILVRKNLGKTKQLP